MTDPTSAPTPPQDIPSPLRGPDEPARMLLHMPVDVRSLSLVVLATLACVFMLPCRFALPVV